MKKVLTECIPTALTIALTLSFSDLSISYRGSQAYNQITLSPASVNTATGTFHFTYPLIEATGKLNPFVLNLVYDYTCEGMFGLPKGWELNVDYFNGNTLKLNGQQWLTSQNWHDEPGFHSGLKYYNQHGTMFYAEQEEKEIPTAPGRYYLFKSVHKDGSENYFSKQGLLIQKRDRFDNTITIDYQKPVQPVGKAKLAAVTDNYGNRYAINFEPNTLVINYPDGRVQRVYFGHHGVTNIVNPMNQSYVFTYTNFNGHDLLETITTPLGLLNELEYGSTAPNLPVVTHFKQSNSSSGKLYHESYYIYSDTKNFSGQPNYSPSGSTDRLMDSNDQSFFYSVNVKQTSGDSKNLLDRRQTFKYNFLHLPVEILTFTNNMLYSKTEYSYSLLGFFPNRTTNYDKPTSIINHTWHKKQKKFIPTTKIDASYDVFGNKTKETYSLYNPVKNTWRQVRALEHKYATDHYSLLVETIDNDSVSQQTMKTTYTLAPSKKTYSSKTTLTTSNKTGVWHPWQQINYTHDKAGRETYSELKWLAKGMPGIQKTHKKTRYLLDKTSGILTLEHENSLGHVTQKTVDTRNNQLLSKTSPLGEKNEFRYNNLGQLIQHTDPDGNKHTIKRYDFSDKGLNAEIHKSPMGYEQRIQKDPLDRVIAREYKVNGKFQLLEQKDYNAYGRIILHKDRFGQKTTYKYDEHFRVKEKIDPWLNKTTFAYSETPFAQTVFFNGKYFKKTSIKPWLLTTETTYYPLGAGKEAIENQVVKNGFGLVVSEQSALVDTASNKKHSVVQNKYEYNPSQNKTKIETSGFDGLSLTKNSTYDLFNNQHTFNKQQSHHGKISEHSGYQYFYNTENKLERIVSPKGHAGKPLVDLYRYDKNGREIEHQLPDGHSIKKQYTASGLLNSISWSRNNKPYKVLYLYDSDGHLIRLSDSQGQHQSYHYEPDGKLSLITYPDNKQQHYQYDHLNRLVKQENPSKTTLTYQYDAKDKGKLSSISDNANHVQFTYGKDDNGIEGRLIAIERDTKGIGKTTAHYGYESFGRVNQVKVTAKDNALVYSANYEFLPRGELVKQTITAHSSGHSAVTKINTDTHYHYDSFKRLTREEHRQTNDKPSSTALSHTLDYQYDGNNNLTQEQRSRGARTVNTTTRHYNSLNQLTKIDQETPKKTFTVAHDANGRMVVDDKGNKYQYDDLGLLLSVTNAHKKVVASFDYLPDGLLGHINTDSGRQDFYYDLNKRALTITKNKRSYDFIQHGGKYLATLAGTHGYQLFMANKSTGAQLGRNNSGHITTNVYSYDGYGVIQPDQGSQSTSDFLWNQEMTNQATGLVYLKNRFYHPGLAQFISKDYRKADNRYVYAQANPITFIDPMGNCDQVSRDPQGRVPSLGGAESTTQSASLSLAGAIGISLAEAATRPNLGLLALQTVIEVGSQSLFTALHEVEANFGVDLAAGAVFIIPAIAHFIDLKQDHFTASPLIQSTQKMQKTPFIKATQTPQIQAATANAFETESSALMSDWQINDRVAHSTAAQRLGLTAGEEGFLASAGQTFRPVSAAESLPADAHGFQPVITHGTPLDSKAAVISPAAVEVLESLPAITNSNQALLYGRFQQSENTMRNGDASLARLWHATFSSSIAQ